MSSSTSNPLAATIVEAVSGNGRNRCAAVVIAGKVEASYHVADYGAKYREFAEAHARRVNEGLASECETCGLPTSGVDVAVCSACAAAEVLP